MINLYRLVTEGGDYYYYCDLPKLNKMKNCVSRHFKELAVENTISS